MAAGKSELVRLTGMFVGKTRAGETMYSGTLRDRDLQALEKLLARRDGQDIVLFAFKGKKGDTHAFTINAAYSRDQRRRIMDDDAPARPPADDNIPF